MAQERRSQGVLEGSSAEVLASQPIGLKCSSAQVQACRSGMVCECRGGVMQQCSSEIVCECRSGIVPQRRSAGVLACRSAGVLECRGGGGLLLNTTRLCLAVSSLTPLLSILFFESISGLALENYC